MSELLNGEIVRRGRGVYNLKIEPNSGSGKLQFSVNNEPMQDILNANSTATLTIPSCRINPVITGDAKVYLTEVS